METTLRGLSDKMNDLIDAKGWSDPDSTRPQTPRNIAASVVIESAEILEHFQFSEQTKDKAGLASEIADVMLYLIQLAQICDIDIGKAALDKIALNHRRVWRN